VAVEITPEPSEEERQAILRALGLEREEADEPVQDLRHSGQDITALA